MQGAYRRSTAEVVGSLKMGRMPAATSHVGDDQHVYYMMLILRSSRDGS